MDWNWAALRDTRVLLEDDDVLVLDKPAGLSVTGERHDVDVVELAAAAGERLFPVHRIDKVTSGAVLLAKNIAAHGPLTRQFADRSATKAYLAVVRGAQVPRHWTVDLPLGVGRKNRVRVAAPREALGYDATAALWSVAESDLVPGRRSYPSLTRVHRVRQAGALALVLAVPATGRRHQIRVHLAWTGTPILGDPLFRADALAPRTYLHSWKLLLRGPGGGSDLAVTADPEPDFLAPVSGPGADGAGGRELLSAAEDVWRDHGRPPPGATPDGRS